jgi:hypothetical protein
VTVVEALSCGMLGKVSIHCRKRNLLTLPRDKRGGLLKNADICYPVSAILGRFRTASGYDSATIGYAVG